MEVWAFLMLFTAEGAENAQRAAEFFTPSFSVMFLAMVTIIKVLHVIKVDFLTRFFKNNIFFL
jgi:hypothetical protein